MAPKAASDRLAGSGTWFASGSGTPASLVKARYYGLLNPLLAKTDATPPGVYFSIVLAGGLATRKDAATRVPCPTLAWACLRFPDGHDPTAPIMPTQAWDMAPRFYACVTVPAYPISPSPGVPGEGIIPADLVTHPVFTFTPGVIGP